MTDVEISHVGNESHDSDYIIDSGVYQSNEFVTQSIEVTEEHSFSINGNGVHENGGSSNGFTNGTHENGTNGVHEEVKENGSSGDMKENGDSVDGVVMKSEVVVETTTIEEKVAEKKTKVGGVKKGKIEATSRIDSGIKRGTKPAAGKTSTLASKTSPPKSTLSKTVTKTTTTTSRTAVKKIESDVTKKPARSLATTRPAPGSKPLTTRPTTTPRPATGTRTSAGVAGVAKSTTRTTTTTKTTTAKPASARPVSAKPATARVPAVKPVTTRPALTKPAASKPATTKPTSARPTSARPTSARPTSAKPATTPATTVKSPRATATSSTSPRKPITRPPPTTGVPVDKKKPTRPASGTRASTDKPLGTKKPASATATKPAATSRTSTIPKTSAAKRAPVGVGKTSKPGAKKAEKEPVEQPKAPEKEAELDISKDLEVEIAQPDNQDVVTLKEGDGVSLEIDLNVNENDNVTSPTEDLIENKIETEISTHIEVESHNVENDLVIKDTFNNDESFTTTSNNENEYLTNDSVEHEPLTPVTAVHQYSDLSPSEQKDVYSGYDVMTGQEPNNDSEFNIENEAPEFSNDQSLTYQYNLDLAPEASTVESAEMIDITPEDPKPEDNLEFQSHVEINQSSDADFVVSEESEFSHEMQDKARNEDSFDLAYEGEPEEHFDQNSKNVEDREIENEAPLAEDPSLSYTENEQVVEEKSFSITESHGDDEIRQVANEIVQNLNIGEMSLQTNDESENFNDENNEKDNEEVSQYNTHEEESKTEFGSDSHFEAQTDHESSYQSVSVSLDLNMETDAHISNVEDTPLSETPMSDVGECGTDGRELSTTEPSSEDDGGNQVSAYEDSDLMKDEKEEIQSPFENEETTTKEEEIVQSVDNEEADAKEHIGNDDARFKEEISVETNMDFNQENEFQIDSHKDNFNEDFGTNEDESSKVSENDKENVEAFLSYDATDGNSLTFMSKEEKHDEYEYNVMFGKEEMNAEDEKKRDEPATENGNEFYHNENGDYSNENNESENQEQNKSDGIFQMRDMSDSESTNETSSTHSSPMHQMKIVEGESYSSTTTTTTTKTESYSFEMGNDGEWNADHMSFPSQIENYEMSQDITIQQTSQMSPESFT